jgi:signal transduction histidine kinase
MNKSNRSDQFSQVQVDLSDLLIKIQRMPEPVRDKISPEIENIYAHLQDILNNPAFDEEKTTAEKVADPLRLQSSVGSMPAWEVRFDPLIARLSAVYYEWDLQTNRWQLSAGLKQITGFNIDSGADHHGWLKMIHKEDRINIEPTWSEIKQDLPFTQSYSHPLSSYEFVYRVRHKDGRWVFIWDRAITERDKQGRAGRALGVLENITRLKHLEQSLLLSNKAMARSNIALRRQEEQVRSALADVPVAFFQTDLSLRYTWIYSPFIDDSTDQYIGKRDDEFLPAESAAEILKIKQKALESLTRLRSEITIHINGKPRQVFVSAQPVLDKYNNVSGVVGAAIDLTEQHSLENLASEKAFKLELNRRLMEQREQQHQQIGRYIQEGPIQDLSGMGFALQLARQLYPGPESLRVLEQLKDEVKNLVIELRQVSNELRPPGLTRFGLSRALQSYTEEFQLKNPNIKINLALTDNGVGLSDQTIQALFHIIEESYLNIIHHAQASEVAVKLNIQPDKIRMEIKDNGKGFDGQVDWLELTHQGCYGLVHMKESAESIGGTLNIQSKPNKGTLVVAEVPLAA